MNAVLARAGGMVYNVYYWLAGILNYQLVVDIGGFRAMLYFVYIANG